MSDMITRCPACETSFRITEAQLRTAKGAVRCGACLHIFKALDHLISGQQPGKKPASPKSAETSRKPTETGRQQPAPDKTADLPKFEYKKPQSSKPTTPPAEPPKTSPEPDDGDLVYNTDFEGDDGMENMLKFDQKSIDEAEETLGDEDDLLISDDLPLGDEETTTSNGTFEGDLNESFIDLDSWQPQSKSLFDREMKPPKHQLGDDEDTEVPDESWAIDLLEEDEDEDENEEPPARFTAPALETEEPDLDSPDSDEPDYSRATTGTFDAIDDSEIEEALGEPLSDEPRVSDDYVDFEAEFAADEEALDDEGFYDEDEDEPERSAMLRRIEPEPVEFSFAQTGHNWKPKLLWGGLTLLGLLLLVVQIGWLQFDNLSRKPPYRDIYAGVCPLVGCEVPPLTAPARIRTTNFVVREHPDVNNALMVDTILLNTAPFNQPFPDLVLTFSNLQGDTVARRRFTPAEYLAGEMAGREQMPSNQPVHLALEIVNPGPGAVNYSAYIPH